jgi:mono/diheme cytochrome c family protein
MPAPWRQPIGAAALVLMLLATTSPAAEEEDNRRRGEYLVRAGNCFSCHTAVGGQPLAGGRAIATPFGTFYSPNITPDPETGIGRWTDAEFLNHCERARVLMGRTTSRCFHIRPSPGLPTTMPWR